MYYIFCNTNYSNSIKSYQLNREATMNNGRCDICNIDVHRASFARQRCKKHIENEKK